MSERIGIFGGTFDPVHKGHVAAAECFISRKALDILYIIPNHVPPLKDSESAPPLDRRKMLELAFSGAEKAHVCDIELERPGVSYTCDTLRELQTLHPGAEFFLLVGDDWISCFARWREYEYILRNATLVIAGRSAQNPEILSKLCIPGGKKPETLGNELIEISSTEFRKTKDASLLPESVYSYIIHKGLYGTEGAQERILNSLRLSERRMIHTKSVADTAEMLAKTHFPQEIDINDARIAALMHDYTKEDATDIQLALCAKYGIVPTDDDLKSPKLLHSKTAAAIAQREFGLSDAICSAVYWHTSGRSAMSPLEAVIYLADYIEPTRKDDSCTSLRDFYYRRLLSASPLQTLYETLAMSFGLTIDYLTAKGRHICADGIAARDYYTMLAQSGGTQ